MAGRQLAVQTVPSSTSSNVLTTSSVNVANGVAGLDASSHVSTAQIPDLSATYTTIAAYGDTWMPADHGLIAWSFDPAASSGGGTQLAVGYIYLAQVVLRVAATINKVCTVIGVAGSSLTANQCFAGLYNSSGSRVGITADQSTAWASTGSKAMSLTTPYSAAAGRYYVALLVNGTTSPYFACGSTLGAAFTPGNVNLSAGSYRFCRSAPGQTSLSSSVTLSGYTPDANNIWVSVL